ncbi:MAG: Site-specific recombinase, invertase Pin-like protein [Spirosoma sp.]|nr:Site-specific recombinase, invertase Pin-like protein [Spirosoma sp.]
MINLVFCLFIVPYACVSKEEQNADLQIDDLKRHGYDQLFLEKVSGARKDRPAFEQMLKALRTGDLLVVWDIDRMGRDTVEMIQTIDCIIALKVGFKSLSQPFIDTTTDSGEFIYKLFALLAEQERKRLVRRTKAGLAAARARGRIGGRPRGLSPTAEMKANAAKTLYLDGNGSVIIMKQLGIKSKETLYRWLRLKSVTISESSIPQPIPGPVSS